MIERDVEERGSGVFCFEMMKKDKEMKEFVGQKEGSFVDRLTW